MCLLVWWNNTLWLFIDEGQIETRSLNSALAVNENSTASADFNQKQPTPASENVSTDEVPAAQQTVVTNTSASTLSNQSQFKGLEDSNLTNSNISNPSSKSQQQTSPAVQQLTSMVGMPGMNPVSHQQPPGLDLFACFWIVENNF